MGQPLVRHSDDVATGLTGWWIDLIVGHLKRKFYGELMIEMADGKVIEPLGVVEVLTAQPGSEELNRIEPWWLDKIQTASIQKYTGVITLTAKAGRIAVMRIPRAYGREERSVQLCR